jgi:hypothetical protein
VKAGTTPDLFRQSQPRTGGVARFARRFVQSGKAAPARGAGWFGKGRRRASRKGCSGLGTSTTHPVVDLPLHPSRRQRPGKPDRDFSDFICRAWVGPYKESGWDRGEEVGHSADGDPHSGCPGVPATPPPDTCCRFSANARQRFPPFLGLTGRGQARSGEPAGPPGNPPVFAFSVRFPAIGRPGG